MIRYTTLSTIVVSLAMLTTARAQLVYGYADRATTPRERAQPIRAIATIPEGPLPFHSHNDYDRARPLLDAFEAGASSVEADVFLVNGQVLVAHDLVDTRPDRTLRSLYIDPLAQLLADGWNDSMPREHLYLMIDLKQGGDEILHAIIRDLEPIAGHLTRVIDGELIPGRVTVFLSGDAPRSTVYAMSDRTVFIDGRLRDLDRDPPRTFIPVVSSRWSDTFSWNGIGAPDPAEVAELQRLVDLAHSQGRLIRFWAAPDTPASWALQRDAGLDLINTDRPAEISAFLLR
jgi:glycerophosphoryl diester phosphodiesterase